MMSAARIMYAMRETTPEAALREALELMTVRVGGDGGGIAVSAGGQVGWWHNSPNMPVAYQTADLPEPRVYLAKSEEVTHGQGRV
jgi:beta-aspartyl-peptidase (threonine type)